MEEMLAQVVLLFGLENWVLLTVTERLLEGTHTDFLRQTTEKRERQKVYRRWVTTRKEVLW